MPELVSSGETIEGARVAGHSRKPLQSLGLALQNGQRCTKFKATFDVKAQIDEAATVVLLVPGAQIDCDCKVICAAAVVFTLERASAVRQSVARGSASHNANHWQFSKQTAVQILSAHEEIRAAMEKRQRLLRG